MIEGDTGEKDYLAKTYIEGEEMTTWSNYWKVRQLQGLCEDFNLEIIQTREGCVIRADHTKYPAFVEDNSLYAPETVDEAIAWIQGLLSDGWRKAMGRGK